MDDTPPPRACYGQGVPYAAPSRRTAWLPAWARHAMIRWRIRRWQHIARDFR
jgi:hypothetical protein